LEPRTNITLPLLKRQILQFLKTNIIFVIIYLITFIFIEVFFFQFEKHQTAKVSQSIEAILRNDLNLNSYYQIARTLSDLETVGFISCSKLVNSELKSLVPYDTQFKPHCYATKFISKDLRGINGQTWTLQYQTANVLWIAISHIFAQASALIFFILIWFSNKRKEDILKLQIAEGKIKTEIAKQVSHDIRSPLSALTMVVGTLKEIPEEKRILIRNATQRINDIANDLLHKGDNNEAGQHLNDSSKTSGNTNENIKLTTEFIPVLIDILTSEKRMQFREYSELEIEVDLKDSFGAFAMVNSNELKRVISNLVNNAVEAFKSHHGRIVVGVKKLSAGNTHEVEISVSDNGKGIPKHILEKLGQMGVSHGKEGTQSGSGLGVYHAKKTAESFGGNFEIDSTEGVGTTIRIILPLAVSPNWFANKIDLTGKKYLVSLDDDISIHQIWAGRLVSLGLSDIEHLRFQSGETFKQYVNSNMNKLKATLFLVDYELLNQPLTGLDIIDELGIEKYSVLVTSRYEEISIQERANRLRLSILPKALAGFVPFETQQTKGEHAGAAVLNLTNTNPAGPTNEEKVLYDLCLIDDDIQLIHPVWAFVAESKGLKIRMFSTPQAFFAVADSIDQRTPIYVDVSLGDGIKGTDVAQEIHKLGFSEINLATGYSADSIEVPSFIRRVVGKDFPG
jgi:signal transduction histidine kinase